MYGHWTDGHQMSIARYARKERLQRGAQKEIAERLGVSHTVVSRVMNDKGADLSPVTRRKIQVAIARKLGLAVDEAFPLEDVKLSA